MEENTTATAAAPQQTCLVCGVIKPMLDQMWSEKTHDHFRNARVEFLKGIRALIDDRIDRMSRHEEKGTRVVVE